MNENNCARYEELCSAAVDHALTEQEQKELDAHLAECPACRAYLEELRVMRELWKELETPMPPALHEKIMGEIEAEVQKTIIQTPQKHRRRPPVFTMLAAAAACVMLAATGSLTGLFGHVGTTPLQAATADASTQTDPGVSTAEDLPRSTIQANDPTADAAQDTQPETEEQTTESNNTDENTNESTQSTEDDTAAAPRSAKVAPKSSSDSAAAQDSGTDSSSASSESNDSAGVATASIMPFSAASGNRSAAADGNSIPQEVSSMSFARCYTVSRTDKSPDSVPVIEDMSLIIAEDNTAYYCVENNESKIEKVLQELEKNGYTTALNQSSGITTQRDAKLVLLLVQQ